MLVGMPFLPCEFKPIRTLWTEGSVYPVFFGGLIAEALTQVGCATSVLLAGISRFWENQVHLWSEI